MANLQQLLPSDVKNFPDHEGELPPMVPYLIRFFHKFAQEYREEMLNEKLKESEENFLSAKEKIKKLMKQLQKAKRLNDKISEFYKGLDRSVQDMTKFLDRLYD